VNLSGFSKLPMLIGPRFKRLIGERGDRERLAALKHQRSKRIHPKRHSVNRERSFQERQKAEEHAKYLANDAEKRTSYKRSVRAYWIGERDSHPDTPPQS
jgi:hypothetical protein